MNPRIVLALAISAGMALLVTGVFYNVAFRDRTGDAAATATTDVVVAVRDLEVGSSIGPADLRMEPWPSDRIPEGVFTEIEQVIERVPVSRVLIDEPVLERRLAERGSGMGLSPKVPDGMRAMSIRVDDVNGVAGFVLPEARVDVLITGVPPNYPQGGQMTRTLLGNVRVLSAGEQLTPDSSGRPQRVAVVTLLLTPEQSEMVTLAQTRGRLQLALRNSRDDAVAESSGVREAELFGVKKPTINVSNPKPRPAPVVLAPPPPPPPPPAPEIEIIRGNRREVQTMEPIAAAR